MMAAWLQAIAGLALNLGFAWLLGSLCARVWLRDCPAAWARVATLQLCRFETATAALVLLASAAAVWAAAAGMAGVSLSEALALLPTVLARTAIGHAALIALVSMLLFGLLAWRAPQRRWSEAAGVVLLAGFAFGRACGSHAAEDGMASLGFVIEWLHLLAIGLWTGMVAVAAAVVLPLARAEGRAPALVRYLDALSATATVALLVIVASGIYNACMRVGAPANLVGNLYGAALLVKVALVLPAIAIGGYNRQWGFPRMKMTGRVSRAVLLVVRGEALLLCGAMAAAALLTSQQPPASY